MKIFLLHHTSLNILIHNISAKLSFQIMKLSGNLSKCIPRWRKIVKLNQFFKCSVRDQQHPPTGLLGFWSLHTSIHTRKLKISTKCTIYIILVILDFNKYTKVNEIPQISIQEPPMSSKYDCILDKLLFLLEIWQ